MDDTAKYKDYIDFDWWSEINKRTIESWIENFQERELALEILDKVIFYNAAQLRKYTECLVNQQKDRIYLQMINESGLKYIDDEMLKQQWRQYLNRMKIFPAKKSNDVVCSANRVIEYWRRELEEGVISDISNLADDIGNGIRHFLLVDDFAGSGSQMLELLDQEVLIDGRLVCIGDIPKYYDDIEIEVALYVIHAEAYRNITTKYTEVRILFVDYIDHNLDYLNPDNHMIQSEDLEKANRFRETINNLQEKLRMEEPEYEKMRKYSLNIPIVFDHGCPNNALLLLFAKTKEWHQLFKRGEREKNHDNSI